MTIKKSKSMLPLRVEPKPKTFPLVTLLLIASNFAVFFHELSLGPATSQFVEMFALVPRHFWRSLGLVVAHPFLYDQWSGGFSPLVTSIFLHGGWLHILGNMLTLWVFGDPIEARMGHFRFFIFYFLTGAIAGLGHCFFEASSVIPCVGASGAIAGLLGACLWLIPRASVVTLVPFFVMFRISRMPAFLFLFLWFVGQVLLVHLGRAGAANGANIAVWAHIVGFIAGLSLVFFFTRKKPKTARR